MLQFLLLNVIIQKEEKVSLKIEILNFILIQIKMFIQRTKEDQVLFKGLNSLKILMERLLNQNKQEKV